MDEFRRRGANKELEPLRKHSRDKSSYSSKAIEIKNPACQYCKARGSRYWMISDAGRILVLQTIA
jgi:hypothetical protein